jgi:hypothetical protein
MEMTTAPATITLTPQFKITFLSVVALTCLAMILSCSMIFAGVEMKPGTEQAGLLQALVTVWKLGFGAIIGMMSGKTM